MESDKQTKTPDSHAQPDKEKKARNKTAKIPHRPFPPLPHIKLSSRAKCSDVLLKRDGLSRYHRHLKSACSRRSTSNRTERPDKRAKKPDKQEKTEDDTSETDPLLPPPPYTLPPSQENSSDTLLRHAPPQIPSCRDSYPNLSALFTNDGREKEVGKCLSLFHWGLVQIMADTFSANVPRLQTFIQEDPDRRLLPTIDLPYKDSETILTAEGETQLEELCNLVRYLEKSLRYNRWPDVTEWELILIFKIVLKHARSLEITADYALEVFGRYNSHKRNRQPRNMVEHWTPSLYKIRPKCTAPMLDLADTLASHASLMRKLDRNNQDPVNHALFKFKKENAMENLQHSKELHKELLLRRVQPGATSGTLTTACFWPVSKEYLALTKILGRWNDRHEYTDKEQRVRLIAARKARSYVQRI